MHFIDYLTRFMFSPFWHSMQLSINAIHIKCAAINVKRYEIKLLYSKITLSACVACFENKTRILMLVTSQRFYNNIIK